jgi:glutamyl-tRNA reductase
VVQSLGGAYVYDVDDLQAVVDRNVEGRSAAAEAGEAMIGPHVLELMGWLSTLHVVPLIRELRGEAEKIRRHELARALKGLDLSPAEAEAIDRMSRTLVNKLLHGPIAEIKARAEAGHSTDRAEEVRRHLVGLEGFASGLRAAAGSGRG